jgi:two-component system, OmpR family, sensor histidine kinase KdpD
VTRFHRADGPGARRGLRGGPRLEGAGGATARRAGVGAVTAVVLLLAGTVGLAPLRDELALPSLVLLYLVPVLSAAAAGGVWPAVGAAVAADLLVNWFFVPPYRTLAVGTRDNLVALIVYLLVAVAAGVAVDLASARARQAQRLAAEAARGRELAQIDRLRSALLGAVGHDLRTPLAGIKIAVSSLRAPDVQFTAGDRSDLLATVEESADRLATVVDNLLAVSRLQAGVLSADIRPTAVDAVAAQAVLATDSRGATLELDVPDDLPLVLADAGLLERVIANLLANACAATPKGTVTVHGETVAPGPENGTMSAGAAAGGGPRRVLLSVVDHGPGIPARAREAAFAPFQRLDDHTGGGLGLGLAIARGFTEAQGGTLTPGETPGGGLTMTISLPVSPAAPAGGGPSPVGTPGEPDRDPAGGPAGGEVEG